MEKTWENFWTSGKIEDYLSYKNSVAEKQTQENKQEEKDKNGTVSSSDRNGAFHHADI